MVRTNRPWLLAMACIVIGIGGRAGALDDLTADEVLAKSQKAMAPPIQYRLVNSGIDSVVSIKDLGGEIGVATRVETVNPLLEQEFAFTPATDFIGELDSSRNNGAVIRQVLAEGVTSLSFATTGLPAGDAELTLNFQTGTGRIALSPVYRERPFR